MEKEKEKVLIIGAGYTEVLDKSVDSQKVSLGDIIRVTPILHAFKEDNVTWVTDEKAFPLLKDNPYITRLLKLNFLTLQQLEHEYFDTIINLEKVPGICAFTRKIDAWKKYGFRFDPRTGEVKAHDKATEVLGVSFNPELKKGNTKAAQELLYEMIGKKWAGEEYILGYKPKTSEIYDIGMNTRVGEKWPLKAWPLKNWEVLQCMLEKDGLKVSRQDKQDGKVLDDLYAYMDWLNSCKLIVTNDSLGLHLALALKKNVLGLFGLSPHREVHFYGRGKAILPELPPECMPCCDVECKRGKSCIEDIYPEQVYREVKNYLNA